MYIRLHPSASAGRGQRLGQTSRFKCKQCGFWVNARTRSNKSQENVADGIQVTGTIAGGDFAVNAKQGCPQCGSFNWSSTVAGFSKQADPNRPRIRMAAYRRRNERF